MAAYWSALGAASLLGMYVARDVYERLNVTRGREDNLYVNVWDLDKANVVRRREIVCCEGKIDLACSKLNANELLIKDIEARLQAAETRLAQTEDLTLRFLALQILNTKVTIEEFNQLANARSLEE